MKMQASHSTQTISCQTLFSVLSTAIMTKTKAKMPTALETVQWLNGKELGYTYRGTRYTYRFALAGNTLEIEEHNAHRIFRKSTVDFAGLCGITRSEVSCDDLEVSSVELEGGARTVVEFLDGRRRMERSAHVWMTHDPVLGKKVARAIAHLRKLVAKSHRQIPSELQNPTRPLKMSASTQPDPARTGSVLVS